jgi:hypothetical protein
VQPMLAHVPATSPTQLNVDVTTRH